MEHVLNFINPEDIKFYLSDGNLLCLELDGVDLGRVAVLRAFPFKKEDEYIVVRKENYSRSDSNNEIGIIKNINSLSDEQIALLRSELSKRYFAPEITEVLEIKEDFGNIFFSVKTNAGEHKFTVTDMGSNIRTLSDNKVLLTDVYGNRYYFSDVSKINDKTMKVLEIWI